MPSNNQPVEHVRFCFQKISYGQFLDFTGSTVDVGRRPKSATRGGTAVLPEVDDEVIIAFMHGTDAVPGARVVTGISALVSALKQEGLGERFSGTFRIETVTHTVPRKAPSSSPGFPGLPGGPGPIATPPPRPPMPFPTPAAPVVPGLHADQGNQVPPSDVMNALRRAGFTQAKFAIG